jgi:hypothetical protein
VQYNVVTWQSAQGTLQQVARKADQVGDGFDDRILDSKSAQRTSNLFQAGENIVLMPILVDVQNNAVSFAYADNDKFSFSATLKFDKESNYPQLSYELIPKIDGYFSVGFTGAPEASLKQVQELWQPLIWQEKRMPDQPYMTLAFQCPVPSAFVTKNNYTVGVVASPREFPFQPLPLISNSRFGVAVHNSKNLVQPLLYAPVLGGVDSKMKAGQRYSFSSYLYVEKGNTTNALENVARNLYGFGDIRHNDIVTLNKTIENINDYTLSKWSWFLDEEKGCAYSTDVPDAVKNVSALNPLEIALISDDQNMFDKRAYPILEYMLSREKFLFIADTAQKIQFPSYRLNGPTAPISELTTLYNIFGKNNPFLVKMAKDEYQGSRVRNLDVLEKGDTWKNSFALYKATGDKKYLDKAVKGANEYISKRVDEAQTSFDDPEAGKFFFWTGYAPKWIDLLELYETTGDEKYLDAAHRGARLYTQYIWYSPRIPNEQITVNKDGKAPVYWYLQRKGHTQMYSPEEQVPAWRLSEIGLTPESSGTSSGHRGIFMANYASWMLRLGYYVKDTFLMQTAKAAIIGRYRNFPGYHINTERTTIYEKENYPLRNHKELSVNSMHYNHIMPHSTLLYDYLITDAYVRSGAEIDFPNEFIEAYAYLQSKLYGYSKGKFYGNNDAQLWMPKGLIQTSSVELNYVSARGDGKMYIAFMNQSKEPVTSQIKIDKKLVPSLRNKRMSAEIYIDNEKSSDIYVQDGVANITVPAEGIVALVLLDVKIVPKFQDELLMKSQAWKNDYVESQDGKVVAMFINLGKDLRRAYIYLKDDNGEHKSARLMFNGRTYSDKKYPFEFTVDVPENANEFEFAVSAVKSNGDQVDFGKMKLSK